MRSRLALGTVQFGLRYGISNQGGQVQQDEAARILAVAREAGIDTLDTAIAYGESERRLGEVGVAGFRVVSKLPPLPAAPTDVRGWVERAVHESLDRLRIGRLTGFLLHRAGDLHGAAGAELYAALGDLRHQRLVEKIGVSVYSPDELDGLWPDFPVDLVQAPFSVLDRQLLTSGWLARLEASGVEVHTRSAFLQGLLVMPPERRPAYFAPWSSLLSSWDAWVADHGGSAVAASLSLPLATPGIDRVVIGVENAGQLQDLLKIRPSMGAMVPDTIQSADPGLINPARWSTA